LWLYVFCNSGKGIEEKTLTKAFNYTPTGETIRAAAWGKQKGCPFETARNLFIMNM
jgi:hypothetical protein